MISQHSSSLRGKTLAEAAARPPRGGSPGGAGGGGSGDSTPASPSHGEGPSTPAGGLSSLGMPPTALVDALHTATSMDAFARAVQALRRAVADTPACLPQVAAAVATNELNWLHVMQRVFNDSQDASNHTALAELICALSTVSEVRLQKTLLAGTLSSLLAVPSVDAAKVAVAITRILREKADAATFLQRQQGLQNVEIFAKQAPLHAFGQLAIHILALDPSQVSEFCKLKLDVIVGQKAITLVKSKADDPDTRDGIRLAMALLRHFVALHATDFGFLQMAVVLCSTQVVKHPAEMSDLTCDVCKTLLASKTPLPYASVPKFLPSLFVCGPYIARRTARYLDLAAYLTNHVCPLLVAARDERSLMQLYACFMHLLRPPFEKSVRLYLGACAALHAVVGSKRVTTMLRVGQLRRMRDFINEIKMDPAEHAANKLIFERFIYQTARDAPSPCLHGIYQPLAARVASGVLTAAEYAAITGISGAYDERRATTFDNHIETFVANARQQVAVLEGQEQEARHVTCQEQDKIFAELDGRHVLQRQKILSSDSERRFETFVLPIRQLLRQRVDAIKGLAVGPRGGALFASLDGASSLVSSAGSTKTTRVGTMRRSKQPGSTVSPGLGPIAGRPPNISPPLSALEPPAPPTWTQRQRSVLSDAWEALVKDESEPTNNVYALHEVEGEEESTRGGGPNFWLPLIAAAVASPLSMPTSSSSTVPVSIAREEEVSWQQLLAQRDQELSTLVSAGSPRSNARAAPLGRRKRQRRELWNNCLTGRLELDQHACRVLLDMKQQFECFVLTSALDALHTWKRVPRRTESPRLSRLAVATTHSDTTVNVAQELRRMWSRSSSPATRALATILEDQINGLVNFHAFLTRIAFLDVEGLARSAFAIEADVLAQQHADRSRFIAERIVLYEEIENERRQLRADECLASLWDLHDTIDLVLEEQSCRGLIDELSTGFFSRTIKEIQECGKAQDTAFALLFSSVGYDTASGPPAATSTSPPSNAGTSATPPNASTVSPNP